MNKKILIRIAAVVLLLAILFVPVPGGAYKDGGTRAYTALTYKVVRWSRETDSGIYRATRVYWLPDNFKSIDQLWSKEENNVPHHFTATILELQDTCAVVEPTDEETALRMGTRVTVDITGLEDIGARVGSDVELYYTGSIRESFPVQIQPTGWKEAANLRHREYTGAWLDPETAQSRSEMADPVTITRIYSDCFFAFPVVPMPYEIKINGTLSPEWCVGDQVTCICENILYDEETHRIEADLVSVASSDWELDPDVCYKPVIYLYPEKETQVSVRLALDGRLTCTYPAYQDGWTVTASPDGTLTDAHGQTYNYLYWEGETHARWDMTRGFCVKGEDTAAFLEHALAQLGLTRREANEFIIFWLPQMEQKPYNVISFQTDAYTRAANLQVDPAPDTLLRVFMAWQPSETFVNLPAQELTAPRRTGFTVVEWGGARLS